MRFLPLLALAACTDPPAPRVMTRLIEASWTIPPNTNAYICAYRTLDEDMLVDEFAPVIPAGTHHTVLSMGDPMHADGVEPCGVTTNARSLVFGSGVGTNAFDFPPGVAVRIPKGKQLILNLHLFNATDDPLSGLSGTDVHLARASDITDEAEGILTGSVDLNVTPGESHAYGQCTLAYPETVFAVGSHMHLMGTHQKVIAAGETLLDHDYSFDEQVARPLDPMVDLAPGDRIDTDCTFENPTGTTVHFGDSTLDEMCFAGVYWFPARGTSLLCLN